MKFKSLILSALVLFAAACSPTNDETSDTATTLQSAQSSARQVSAASGISFKNMDGQVVNLESYSDKVVLVNFWATWCGPCLIEMPSLQELYDKYKTHPDVEFFVVEVDNKPVLAKDFVAEKNYTFPIYSPGSHVPETFLAGAIPTTVILSKQGKIEYRREGTTNFVGEEFLNQFEEILNM